MMRLKFLPGNEAWAFLFGDDPATAQITEMGDFGRFFTNRQEAVKAAQSCGLQVDEQGAVHRVIASGG